MPNLLLRHARGDTPANPVAKFFFLSITARGRLTSHGNGQRQPEAAANSDQVKWF